MKTYFHQGIGRKLSQAFSDWPRYENQKNWRRHQHDHYYQYFRTILHKNTKCCWPRLFILNSSHHIFIQLWWRGKKWVHVKNVDFYAVHHENMQLYQLKLETIINLQVILTHSDLNQKCTFSAVFLITAQNILRNQDINNQLHMPQQQSLFIRHAKLRNKQF